MNGIYEILSKNIKNTFIMSSILYVPEQVVFDHLVFDELILGHTASILHIHLIIHYLVSDHNKDTHDRADI